MLYESRQKIQRIYYNYVASPLLYHIGEIHTKWYEATEYKLPIFVIIIRLILLSIIIIIINYYYLCCHCVCMRMRTTTWLSNMAESIQHPHRPGPLKQQNKAHKHGKHKSKGTIASMNKGGIPTALLF